MLFELRVKTDSVHFYTVNNFIFKQKTFMTKYLRKYILEI